MMGITSKNRAVFSSLTHEWATPQAIFDELDREFSFQIDVAASKTNAKCKRYFTKKDNGLLQRWAPFRCFCNPPYGRNLSRWMHKAAAEWLAGATVVCLVPARTDTGWWHDLVLTHGAEVRFIRGRLRFNEFRDAKRRKRATFPSCVVIFRAKGGPCQSTSQARSQSIEASTTSSSRSRPKR